MRFQEATEYMKQLKPLEITLVLVALFQSKKIDFVKVCELYVKSLEEEKDKNRSSIAVLGLMLASYCIKDKSPAGENARKHLYESGAFGHNDGSGFGKQLDEEFSNEQLK